MVCDLMPESGFLKIDDAVLHYVCEGTGEPVLILGSSIYYPRTFADSMRNSCRLICADLRHFSDAGCTTTSATDIEIYVRDIEEIRTTLGLRKFVLLGHSHHGNVAIEYANRYPDAISHLVLVGTPPGNVHQTLTAARMFWERCASPTRKERLRQNLQSLAESGSGDFVARYVAEGPMYWYDPEYNGSWLWRDVPVNLPQLTAFKQFFVDYDFGTRLEALRMPVLAIIGQCDFVVPPSMWERRATHPSNLTLKYFNKSGHTPQLEEPDLFTNVLLDWMEQTT